MAKRVSANTAMKGRDCGDKVPYAAETQSMSKEDTIREFLDDFQ